MTKKQLELIAREFALNRKGFEGESEKQRIVDNLAIDVANAINSSSGNLNRSGFLKACGHPEYQELVASALGVTKL